MDCLVYGRFHLTRSSVVKSNIGDNAALLQVLTVLCSGLQAGSRPSPRGRI